MFDIYLTLFGIVFTWLITLTIWLSKVNSRTPLLWTLVIDMFMRKVLEKYFIIESSFRFKVEEFEKLPPEVKEILNELATNVRKKISKYKSFEKALPYLLKLVNKRFDRLKIFQIAKIFDEDLATMKILLALYIWYKVHEKEIITL